MPELPEVETVRTDLAAHLCGQIVTDIKILNSKTVSPLGSKFKKYVVGAKIESIERRGKLLIWQLNNNHRLHVHLKMTGQLVLQHDKLMIAGGHPDKTFQELPNKHTRVIFVINSGAQLYFNDMRKFGYIKLIDNKRSDEIIAKSYGVEPLTSEFTFKKFKQLIARKNRRNIKAWLLDQTLVAGLGNIYADEVCFAAKVNPEKKVLALTESEQMKIYRAIKKILALAVKHRGTTFNNYVGVDGRAGKFWQYCQVYGRGGQNCYNCQQLLSKIVVAGRGTVYCEFCQKI